MMQVKLHCKVCEVTLKVGVVEPSPAKNVYTYCPVCGNVGVVIDQFTTEEYSLEVLAESWNIPVTVLKMFYDAWISTPNSPKTLREFMIQRLEVANANTG